MVGNHKAEMAVLECQVPKCTDTLAGAGNQACQWAPPHLHINLPFE